jgi:hypothetical protein
LPAPPTTRSSIVVDDAVHVSSKAFSSRAIAEPTKPVAAGHNTRIASGRGQSVGFANHLESRGNILVCRRQPCLRSCTIAARA